MIDVMFDALTLTTPWADSIGDAPLPEYPRPMLARSQWLSLNGWWRYAITGASTDDPAEPRIDHWDGRILVPFAVETDASGIRRPLLPHEALHYEADVVIPEQWRGSRIQIHFEAVDHACDIWADSVRLAHHEGGYLPFSVELPNTHAQSVRLRLRVTDPTDSGMQPHGKQSLTPATIWYTATSGIWQSVWMEPLPRCAITRIGVRTREDLESITLMVSAEKAGLAAQVMIGLPDGGTLTHECTTGEPCVIAIPRPRLWSPDDPHLYPLHVRVDEDEAESWFGMRTIAIAEHSAHWEATKRGSRRYIELNGRPFFVNAPLSQGYWPESGLTAPSEAALVHDLSTMKAMGFNGVRVHITIASRRFYHLADRLGMVIVQDAVSGGRPPANIRVSGLIQATDFTASDRLPLIRRLTGRTRQTECTAFLNHWVDTIHHLEIHPSIVMWVPFNEGWGQFDARRVDELTRRTDPTRLVDAASGWFDQGVRCSDVRSRHRYVLSLIPPPAHDPRPFYLSEFGGLNLAVTGHINTHSEDYGYSFYSTESELAAAFTDLYRTQLIGLVDYGLTAATYTQVSDVETETNGLMTYDRRVIKMKPDAVRALNEELLTAFAHHHEEGTSRS